MVFRTIYRQYRSDAFLQVGGVETDRLRTNSGRSQFVHVPSWRDLVEVLYPPSYTYSHPISLADSSDFLEDSFLSLLPGSQTSRHPPRIYTSCPLLDIGLNPRAIDCPGYMQIPRVGKQLIIGGRTEDSDALPAYSRFDMGSPRSQVAPDVLGPYPHISVLNT